MKGSPVTAKATRKFMTASAIALAIGLGACTIDRQPHGYIMDEELAGAIVEGFDNMTSVAQMMGNPSMKGTFDENVWYYISEKSRRRSFFKPTTTERNILAVHFDQIGMVDSLRTYTLDDAVKVKPRRDKTPTRGRKLGFFEQIFSNVGRFSSLPGQAPQQ